MVKYREVRRINRACKYYPCHKGLEDCTFCYCPFYPCLDEDKGKHIYSRTAKESIWSCQGCGWVHKKRTVDSIFKLIRVSRLVPKMMLKNNTAKGTGVIILAHGSRLKDTKKSVHNVIRVIRQGLGLKDVAPAFLQLCKPALAEAVQALMRRRCAVIIIVPYFLFNGSHMTRDIPRAIEELKRGFPQVKFVFAKNLSYDECMISHIVIDRIKEALFHADHKCA